MFTYNPSADEDLPIFSTGMIGQYAHGNEPSHHVIYLFNAIGQPWKTQLHTSESSKIGRASCRERVSDVV